MNHRVHQLFSKLMSHPPVYLVSLGCAKNLVDSEVMLGKLLKAGYPVVTLPQQAEIIIVNTCSFIQAAIEESRKTIFELGKYKKSGKCKYLIVSGCLPQRYGKLLGKIFPEVDAFVGSGEFYRITEIIAALYCFKTQVQFYLGKPVYLYNDRTFRVNTSLPGSAYIKIAEGCSHYCSFCLIPKIRGRFRSRAPDSIIKEATNLALRGVKEINLIAQDITRYGYDLSPRVNLVDLLRRLVKVEGIEWLRMLYANPQGINDELIEIMKEEKRICKYLDFPVQHINSEILKAMKRKHSSEFLYQLIAKIRKSIPQITLRTTLMVGFPGEREEQFNELIDFVKQVKFDRLGVFAYSPEKGTPAFRLPNQIPEEVKQRRKHIILQLQAEISRRKNKKLVGSIQKVIIEKKSLSGATGRISSQAPEVDGITRIVGNTKELSLGGIYDAAIIRAGTYDLIGEIYQTI
ncbi:MAG: 30S ribosomal protein S12 methylthiotransferase RimO [Desulfobacterota bacterium]|nr:30S ribosomal protein S12 methylthiotransferase RimO [Thermodesulfobacteriota bacterium]